MGYMLGAKLAFVNHIALLLILLLFVFLWKRFNWWANDCIVILESKKAFDMVPQNKDRCKELR